MPISNLVETAVNRAEKVTGKDIDGDGDVGVAGWGTGCAKEQLDDAKEKTNLNANAIADASTFPIFDPVSPKVSILSIGKNTLESANELVKDAFNQTGKFKDLAYEKAGFMLQNYQMRMPGGEATKCTFQNATGVRFEIFEDGSKGLLSEYKPPSILEPGEIASFLVDGGSTTLELKVNIQTFQGPMAGWVRGDPSKTVVLKGDSEHRSSSGSIDAFVQVMGTETTPAPKMYATNIGLLLFFGNDGTIQITATQVIGKPLS